MKRKRTSRKSRSNRIILQVQNWRAAHRPGNPARIPADPELQAFVDAALPEMTYAQVVTACRERFGDQRAPSKSAIGRYWASQTVEKQGEPSQ